jgi:small subunit ribosomal protein S3
MSYVKNILTRTLLYTEIEEFLEKVLADAGFSGIEIEKLPLGTRINIYALKPGLVIGRKGTGIRELTEQLSKKFKLQNLVMNVVEVQTPELDPRIVAQRIANAVQRGIPFRRAAMTALNSVMKAGALGCEIVVSGKIRSERAHFEKYRDGIVPKSGHIKDIAVKEAVKHVLLKMGLYGIKVKIAYKEAIPEEFRLKEEVKQDANT